MNSGVMFVATPGNQVIALDAKSGQLIWRYRRPLPEGVVLLHPTSRGVALHGDKVLVRRGRGRARGARREIGQGDLDHNGGRQQPGVLHVACPAGGRQHGDDRRVGRRIWRARFHRGVRHRERPRTMEDLHGSCSWRTRQRDVAQRRAMEDRRRIGVGHGQLRSRDEPGLLGHRQRRTVDGRSTSRRQPLHVIHGRDRRRHRRDQRPLSIPSERLVGLGRGLAADPR